MTAYVGPTKITAQSDAAPDPATQPSAAEMVRRSHEITRLSAEISESMEIYSKQPKHRYISSNTKAFRDAAYLDDWRRKIEYIGNLNYPEEAKRRDLSGNLVLDVAIRADGTLDAINIRRSSGQRCWTMLPYASCAWPRHSRHSPLKCAKILMFYTSSVPGCLNPAIV